MRRLVILKTVIELYIERGEPVGSRVIADQYLRDVSSATIRNDMAALEQMGYLHQPHTSAGPDPDQPRLPLLHQPADAAGAPFGSEPGTDRLGTGTRRLKPGGRSSTRRPSCWPG